MYLTLRYILIILSYHKSCNMEVDKNILQAVLDTDQESYVDITEVEKEYIYIFIRRLNENHSNIIKLIKEHVKSQNSDSLIYSIILSLYIELYYMKQNKTYTVLDYLTTSSVIGFSQKEINFINKIINNIYKDF